MRGGGSFSNLILLFLRYDTVQMFNRYSKILICIESQMIKIAQSGSQAFLGAEVTIVENNRNRRCSLIKQQNFKIFRLPLCSPWLHA